ncbi:uncharacterized protein MONOS_4405 [Monocercomonoides exilis]|uniref:uncharacterized protein n=1 Tax=Monocercomonoides exilis TaxID=2049356 RepID=UPI00355A0611|nr:hypothetical protein MONOS_4405 [Monocercomonoides exilis]|eukprot:MONOS_4405.1-p1 / transcript=MONOS_4405.1 / gene=MONOS_4405 / organism=Monocercomonoides_exilis_PA203 / gene_product=unspecified product / transcript_product=unspecified product / location=Mono_scaffold00117:25981-26769(+) / protein_length=215 / sequence_SO=supercontig / SO=protein_coding / is_pseudo=false
MTNPQTDSDNVIQQLIDSMSTEQHTMGERMKDHLVDLNSIFEKLPRNFGLVQTAHGGLHIYCELCGYPLKCSSQAKVFTSPENDIEIFAGIGNGKQRLVIQADSSHREMKGSKKIITKYIPFNNYRELRDLSPLESVLDIFVIDLKTENTSVAMSAEPHNLLTQDSIVDMFPTVALALVDGLKDVEIHNDTCSLSLDSELTLFRYLQPSTLSST